MNRADAAQITNELTHNECEQILKVSDDDKKVQHWLVRAASAAGEKTAAKSATD